MSSPRKKLKLTPRKQRHTSELRDTQESKITSTPQRESAKVSSPDLSSIVSSAPKLSDSSRAEESTSSSSITSRPFSPTSVAESEKSGVLALEDYDAYINTCQRVKYRGRIWALYKPSDEDTLYAQIIENPRNIKNIVMELLLGYGRYPEKNILSLLNFCVDVCGFHSFEVENHYNFHTDTSKSMVEVMESDRILANQKVLMDTGRYLLMEPSTALSQFLKVSIYSFLDSLILGAHEKRILYEEFFAKHFFDFIKCMSSSKISAIRHTGVIFGIKILTAVVKIYNGMEEGDSSNDSSYNIEAAQKQEIENYLQFFYLIFMNNCGIQDNKLIQMRIECIYELSIWVRHFPKMFITHFQSVHYLIKLISDPVKNVRFAALETCEAFVNTPEILSFIKDLIPDFTEYIGKRFYDVDDKVAMKAINIYRNLLRHNESLISEDRFKMLMYIVFDKSFPIGEAASRFLVDYLEKNEDSPEAVLLKLANFSMKPGDAIKQLLVEGCLSSCPEIRNWGLYLKIFQRGDVELDIKNHLAGLFAEAVHQVLIGQATILREKPRKVVIIDTDEDQKVASRFHILCTLLKTYTDQPQILTEFLKILTTVRNTIINEITPNFLKKICITMKDLFLDQEDEALLRKLGTTFHYFSKCATHTDNVLNIVENISSKYHAELAIGLNSQDKNIYSLSLKLSILFEHFDLSEKFTWKSIFDNWGIVDEASVANLMCCCKWYLIWSLKRVTAENYAARSPLLVKACNEFTTTCFNNIHQHLDGRPLHFKTYDCLCDMYFTYTTELLELVKFVKQMERLKLKIDDNQLDDVLVSFLEKYVICSTTMPLSERRSYVVKYMNLVHVNVLSMKSLANIYRYYHTYNQEYGPMIESSLSDLAKRDENGFLFIIIYTATVVYEQILEKNPVINMTTQDVPSLKLLLKQFLCFKEFRSPTNKFVKLIYFSINYSVTEESKFPFLYFAKYFGDQLIHEGDRDDALKYLRGKVPKAAQKNDAILFFAHHLKSLKFVTAINKTPKLAGKPKPVNVPMESRENVKPKKKNVSPRKSGPSTSGKKSGRVESKSAFEEGKKRVTVDTETDVSDDLTIHDSESDDMDESFSALKV